MKYKTLIIVFLLLLVDPSLAGETNRKWHDDVRFSDLTGVWRIKDAIAVGDENFDYLIDKNIYFFQHAIQTPEDTLCETLSTERVKLDISVYETLGILDALGEDNIAVKFQTNCKTIINGNITGIVDIYVFRDDSIFIDYASGTGGINGAALELTKDNVEQVYRGEILQIALAYSIRSQTYPKPEYQLISEEKLDKVCRTDRIDRCSTTVKKNLSSSDGFLFEVFQTDPVDDAVWCYGHYDDVYPCSTVGDSGGGRNELTVTNVITKQQLLIMGKGSARVARIPTPMNYPYIIFDLHGGGSWGAIYEFYLKDNLSLEPFQLYGAREAPLITKDNRTFFYGAKEMFKDSQRESENPLFIDDLITEHFDKQ